MNINATLFVQLVVFFIGAWVTTMVGLGHSLWVFGFLQVFSNLGYYFVSLAGGPVLPLIESLRKSSVQFVLTASETSALFGKTVTAIAAGGYHSLALCSDGTLAASVDFLFLHTPVLPMGPAI